MPTRPGNVPASSHLCLGMSTLTASIFVAAAGASDFGASSCFWFGIGAWYCICARAGKVPRASATPATREMHFMRYLSRTRFEGRQINAKDRESVDANARASADRYRVVEGEPAAFGVKR